MRRWAIFSFLVFFLASAILIAATVSGVKAQGDTQSTPGVTAMVITAQAVTAEPMTPAPGGSGESGVAPAAVLVLTLNDSGGTFTIRVGTQIILMIPRLPNMQLSFDPSILQLIEGGPIPYAPADGLSNDPSMNPPDTGQYRAGGWRLVAIQPGVTPLTAVTAPCTRPPCPMMPTISFSVNIVVRGGVNPPPPGAAETYIGTAYLDKTVAVQVGTIVRLDLPYLSEQQTVQLQYNAAVLQPLGGQDLTHPQRNGWRFLVVGPGLSPIVVMSTLCSDEYSEGTTCAPQVVFQVTVTTSPAAPN